MATYATATPCPGMVSSEKEKDGAATGASVPMEVDSFPSTLPPGGVVDCDDDSLSRKTTLPMSPTAMDALVQATLIAEDSYLRFLSDDYFCFHTCSLLCLPCTCNKQNMWGA